MTSSRHQQLTDELTAAIQSDVQATVTGQTISLEALRLAIVESCASLDLAPPGCDLHFQVEEGPPRRFFISFTTYDL